MDCQIHGMVEEQGRGHSWECLIHAWVKSRGFVKYRTPLKSNILDADIINIFKSNPGTKVTQ